MRRRPSSNTRPWLTAVVVLTLAAAACSPSTATAPTGDLTLTATFDDAQDLVPGHTVQVSNVVVGSITDVELDGYRAEVTMSIVDSRQVPVGTQAVLRRTSLLGEHYVDLVFPEGFDPDTSEIITEDTEIEQTAAQPDFEELAGKAGEVIGAIAADDLSAIIDAGATGLGGRGETLDQLVDGLAQVLTTLAGQRQQIGATIDSLAGLGQALEPASEQIGTLIEDVADASGALAVQRERILSSLRQLTRLATVTNDTVFEPHAERLANLLQQAAPVVDTLAKSRGTVESLVTNLATFAGRIDNSISSGALLVFAWVYAPSLFEQSAGTAVPFDSGPDDPVESLIELLEPT